MRAPMYSFFDDYCPCPRRLYRRTTALPPETGNGFRARLVALRHSHHRYPTHWPLLWLLALVGALHYWRKTRRPAAAVALLVAVNGMVHMLLDSIVGDIFWLMPWRDTPFSFFTVSARYQPWWLNFILHWSFLLEFALWAWAGALFLRQRRQAHER